MTSHAATASMVLALTAFVSGDTDVSSGTAFRPIGSFSQSGAAVCAFSGPAGSSTAFPGSKSVALLTTSFIPFRNDEIGVIVDFESAVNQSEFHDTVVETSTKWPNMVTSVPESEFGVPTLLVAGGFLVPGKTPGSVDLFQFSNSSGSSQPTSHVQVSTDKEGFFYHKAILTDLDGDGHNDILAARAKDPTSPFQKKASELVWFRRPDDVSQGGPWNETVLFTNGPDVSFVFDDFDGDGKMELLATEFFVNQRLALYSCTKGPRFADCSEGDFLVTVIDDENGPFFGAQHVDLNGDGMKDLLVTNNRDDGKGSVFAYEKPSGRSQLLNASAWAAPHVLATGYKPPASIAPGKGAPGTAVAFHAQVTASTGKPTILLSGDDSGVADLLVATDKSTSTWTYNATRVATVYDTKAGGTVGTIAVADTDGDGWMEFAVPLFSDNNVKLFTFAPANY